MHAKSTQGTAWFHGWNIIGACLLFQMLTMGVVQSSFTIWVQPWMTEFGTTRAQTMVALMAVHFAGAVLSAFAGRAMDRFELRWLVAGGIALFALAMAAMAAAPDMLWIILIYAIVLPATQTFAGPLAAQALAAKWFTRHRGLAIGWASLGTSFGGLVAPPVLTWLLLTHGWRVAHVIVAVFAALVVLPISAMVVRSPPGESRAAAHAGSAYGDALGFANIVRHRTFWIAVLGFVPLNMVNAGLQANWSLLLGDVDAGPEQVAWLISAQFTAIIAGKLIIGPLADRIDHRRIYVVIIALIIASLALLLTAASYPAMLVAAVLLGFGLGGNLPLIGAIIAAQFGPAAFGRVLGLFFTTMIAAAIAAPTAGYIRDVTGSYDTYLAGSMLFVLLLSASMAWLPGRLAPDRTATGT
ncbi:MAG: MFS transporter [Gammaproteobacteria bacterium]